MSSHTYFNFFSPPFRCGKLAWVFIHEISTDGFFFNGCILRNEFLTRLILLKYKTKPGPLINVRIYFYFVPI